MRISKKYRLTAAALLAASSVVTVAPGLSHANSMYKDVSPSAPYYKDLVELVNQGIISGYADKTFKPDVAVTRGHYAQMLAQLLKLDTSKVNDPYLSDVTPSNPFYKYIAALAGAGVDLSYEDGSFKPNQAITRLEAAQMLADALDLKPTSGGANYNDVPMKHAAAVKAVVQNGLMKAPSSRTFNSNGNISRAESVSLLSGIQAFQQDEGTFTFNSLTSAGQVSTSEGTYRLSAEMKKIFNSSNAAALSGAQIKAVISNNQIIKVTGITFNQSGSTYGAVTFNAGGAKIEGNVFINADYLRLQNVKINGNVTVNDEASYNLTFDNVTVKQSVVIEDGYSSSFKFAANNSTIPQLYVKRDNTLVNADQKITAIVIEGDADDVALNTRAGKVTVAPGMYPTITGYASIDEMIVERGADVDLRVNGTLAKLNVVHGDSTVYSNRNLLISNVLIPSGSEYRDIIANYSIVSNYIMSIQRPGSTGNLLGINKVPNIPDGVLHPGAGGGGDGSNTGGISFDRAVARAVSSFNENTSGKSVTFTTKFNSMDSATKKALGEATYDYRIKSRSTLVETATYTLEIVNGKNTYTATVTGKQLNDGIKMEYLILKSLGTAASWADRTDTWTISFNTLNGTLDLRADLLIKDTVAKSAVFSLTGTGDGGTDDQTVGTLTSIKAPQAKTGVKNGTAKTAQALGLPTTVKIETSAGEKEATVSWDMSNVTYDPNKKDAQTFTVSGTVTLPTGVTNPNNVGLTTTISVTVDAESKQEVTLTSITAPQAKTGVKNGTEKTAVALGLPTTVKVETSAGEKEATVSWDMSNVTYDPNKKDAQTFTVSGTVTLPTDVTNPNNVGLTTTISVTVEKATPEQEAIANYENYVTVETNETNQSFTVTYGKDGKTLSDADKNVLAAYQADAVVKLNRVLGDEETVELTLGDKKHIFTGAQIKALTTDGKIRLSALLGGTSGKASEQTGSFTVKITNETLNRDLVASAQAVLVKDKEVVPVGEAKSLTIKSATAVVIENYGKYVTVEADETNQSFTVTYGKDGKALSNEDKNVLAAYQADAVVKLNRVLGDEETIELTLEGKKLTFTGEEINKLIINEEIKLSALLENIPGKASEQVGSFTVKITDETLNRDLVASAQAVLVKDKEVVPVGEVTSLTIKSATAVVIANYEKYVTVEADETNRSFTVTYGKDDKTLSDADKNVLADYQADAVVKLDRELGDKETVELTVGDKKRIFTGAQIKALTTDGEIRLSALLGGTSGKANEQTGSFTVKITDETLSRDLVVSAQAILVKDKEVVPVGEVTSLTIKSAAIANYEKYVTVETDETNRSFTVTYGKDDKTLSDADKNVLADYQADAVVKLDRELGDKETVELTVGDKKRTFTGAQIKTLTTDGKIKLSALLGGTSGKASEQTGSFTVKITDETLNRDLVVSAQAVLVKDKEVVPVGKPKSLTIKSAKATGTSAQSIDLGIHFSIENGVIKFV